jgi:hypothetical protein
MVNKTIVNEHCPVRDRMLVEQGKPFCNSRELQTIFQVSDGACANRSEVIIFYQHFVSTRRQSLKHYFHNRLIRKERLATLKIKLPISEKALTNTKTVSK